MNITFLEQIPIRGDSDIVNVRRKVRDLCKKLGFSLADVTRVVTASSELSRNIYHYAREGTLDCYSLEEGIKKGIKLIFIDHGEGIENIEQAMEAGFSTGDSMGLGLPGTKRLMDEMTVESELGNGMRVEIIKWM